MYNRPVIILLLYILYIYITYELHRIFDLSCKHKGGGAYVVSTTTTLPAGFREQSLTFL